MQRRRAAHSNPDGSTAAPSRYLASLEASARLMTMTLSASAFSTAAARMRTAALISFMAERTLPSGSMSVTCQSPP